jgi:hypothetical protein
MRCIVDFTRRPDDLPLLRFYIHGAPHRRQHMAVIGKYRDELYAAGVAAGLRMPIKHPIAVSVLFIDPCSPDLDNLLMALYRALDGTSHNEPTILADDGLIFCIERMGKFYPNEATKADRVMRLPRLVIDNVA